MPTSRSTVADAPPRARSRGGQPNDLVQAGVLLGRTTEVSE